MQVKDSGRDNVSNTARNRSVPAQIYAPKKSRSSTVPRRGCQEESVLAVEGRVRSHWRDQCTCTGAFVDVGNGSRNNEDRRARSRGRWRHIAGHDLVARRCRIESATGAGGRATPGHSARVMGNTGPDIDGLVGLNR